jgi:hypothetical protein
MQEYHTMMSFVEIEQAVKQMSDDERQQLQALLETLQRMSNTADAPKQRIAGLHDHLQGFWMSDDFNDELPDSFWFGEEET